MNRRLAGWAALGVALVPCWAAVEAWDQDAMLDDGWEPTPAATAIVVSVAPPPVPPTNVRQEAPDVDEPADRGVAFQLTDTIAPPPTTTLPRHPHHDTWLALAQCESGGDWSINTGNGYYGGLQFNLETWRVVGGSGWPHQATVWEQMFRAELVLVQRAEWGMSPFGAWPQCARRLGLL